MVTRDIFQIERQRPVTCRKIDVHSSLYHGNEVSSTFENRFVVYVTVSHTPQKNPEPSISFQLWDNRHIPHLNRNVGKTLKKSQLESWLFLVARKKYTIFVRLQTYLG